MSKLLPRIYHILADFYGPREDWYGKTRDEIIIGTMLTQNTNWHNVEKALANLRQAGLLSLPALSRANAEDLAALIRPCGYHHQKAQRLINIAGHLQIEREITDWAAFRTLLLSLHGIGPETADSILLYAYHHPVFVIDAYTQRVFQRLGICQTNYPYHALQQWVMEHLPPDNELYGDFHRLIVMLAKSACLKQPRCQICPLADMCSHEAE